MKARIITIILITFSLISCVKERQLSALPFDPPFKPALEQIITGLVDSLKDEIKENKLLSIQFFTRKYHDPPGIRMRIFLSDWYASGSIDGYTKLGNTTIAIYNVRDDYCELVNKNAITFFTDTLVGFRDVYYWEVNETGYKAIQLSYYLIGEDSISEISTNNEFGSLPYPDLIRIPKCKDRITYISQEYIRFQLDSIQTERDYKYYKEKVKYFRNKSNSPRRP
jgi:hypothetical protein